MYAAAISLSSAQAWSFVRQPPVLEQVFSRSVDPVYRFLNGYSIQQAAQEMGIAQENVQVIQHRAPAKAVQVGKRLL